MIPLCRAQKCQLESAHHGAALMLALVLGAIGHQGFLRIALALRSVYGHLLPAPIALLKEY